MAEEVPYINADEDPDNADWLKFSGEKMLASFETKEDILEWLSRHDVTVAEFRQTPLFLENVGESELLQEIRDDTE